MYTKCLIANYLEQVDELTRSRSLTELEKTTEHRVAESAKSTAKHMQKQAALSAEKASKNKGIIYGIPVIFCNAVYSTR